MTQLAKHQYRPDIDGLRAIAVFLVVGFHAFPERIEGGFIGVDIFFVISGFLISKIIFDHLDNNCFSLSNFYCRRIKRIFPSLLVVLIVTYSFGWMMLTSTEFSQLGAHIASGAGFSSNFILWIESGYFDKNTYAKPLLHLWSLGIEEQYYILWPILLWSAWQRQLNLLMVTTILGIGSFLLNLNSIQNDTVAAFYSPQTRFWELLIGSALAGISFYRKNENTSFISDVCEFGDRGRTLSNMKSLVGAAFICIGIITINKERAFPGAWALLPTLGAAMVISAGEHAWLNRTILSNRILVWFGLISFPLYLWHWPLLSFAYILGSRTPGIDIRIAAILISIMLSWITYRLIENPIRSNQVKKRHVEKALVALIVVVGFAGYLAPWLQETGLRDSKQFIVVKYEGEITAKSVFDYMAKNFYPCTPASLREGAMSWREDVSTAYVRCFQSKKSDPVKIAIIGDSHAEDLFIGLADELIDVNVVYYAQDGLPRVGNGKFGKIFTYILDNPDITTVILSGSWYGRLGEIPAVSTLKNELSETIRALIKAKKFVYITDDVHHFSFPPELCKYGRRISLWNTCIEDISYFHEKYKTYYSSLELLERENSTIKLLRITASFCGKTFCSMERDGEILYRDTGHLTVNGSKFVGKKIVESDLRLCLYTKRHCHLLGAKL